MRGVLSATLLSLLLWGVCADMYLHYPPGCNDRNRERNENRNNDQRLFNSQNNGKGGYPWRGDATKQAAPDPLVYYPGSVLRIEWTNQHACGPNTNTNCQVVIQYACNADTPGIRDGYPNSATVVESDGANAGYKRLPFTTGNGQNPDGTATIPENQFAGNRVARKQYYYTVDTSNPGVEFGMHEGVDWYDLCRLTQRNKGLYIADRNLGGNDARFTRQNNNGQRHGLECPEERDYYPYWRPYKFQVGGATPSINPTVTDTTNAILDQTLAWYDVAILTTRTDWCPYFQANSQNVRGYGQCICTTATPPGGGQSCFQRSGNLIPWDQATCQTNLGTWVVPSANGLGAGRPDCLFHDFGRDNHLGNTQPVDGGANPIINSISPEASHYDWTIPDRMAGQQCIIRTRYNISTGDYPSTNFLTRSADAINVGDLDSRYNCKSSDITNTARQGIPDPTAGVPVTQLGCKGLFNEDVVPLFNRPYIDVFGTQAPSKLSIALNTDQSGRTFQDRSYVFAVAGSNPGCGGTIFNLNFRGRRGNIVQAYPAVEYDFVPQRLTMKNGDCVHIQLHGSDFNQAQNANNGEGWQFSDRVNLVQTEGPSDNFPLAPSQMTLFPDTAQAIKWALLGQTVCQNIADNGQDTNRNQITNCGKLNSAPNRFPPNPLDGMIKMTRAGTYYYASTRNNNFSNRSMKGMIIVGDAEAGLTQAQVAGIVIGTLAGVGLLAGGILFYGKRHPNTRAGAAYQRVAGCFNRGGSSGSTYSGSTFSPSNTSGGKAPPDMEYTRH